jgi:hypothetical protein
MTCPLCAHEMQAIADNLAAQSWGCTNKECAAFLYRAKPRQATGPDTGKLVNCAEVDVALTAPKT